MPSPYSYDLRVRVVAAVEKGMEVKEAGQTVGVPRDTIIAWLARKEATGYLFETNRHLPYSPRRIQQLVKAMAVKATIKKRVYPHLLRHCVATTLLERGMPLEQLQKFLGHAKLETTQVYAESTPAMIKESYRRALAE